jgi:hypothetical protein
MTSLAEPLACSHVGRFSGLRIDYSFSLLVSLEALFALAQLGGIPRPSRDLGPRDLGATVTLRGSLFWSSWMMAQLLQWTCLVISLVFLVAAFLSLRFGLRPCLVVDRAGIPVLDSYAVLR